MLLRERFLSPYLFAHGFYEKHENELLLIVNFDVTHAPKRVKKQSLKIKNLVRHYCRPDTLAQPQKKAALTISLPDKAFMKVIILHVSYTAFEQK